MDNANAKFYKCQKKLYRNVYFMVRYYHWSYINWIYK